MFFIFYGILSTAGILAIIYVPLNIYLKFFGYRDLINFSKLGILKYKPEKYIFYSFPFINGTQALKFKYLDVEISIMRAPSRGRGRLLLDTAELRYVFMCKNQAGFNAKIIEKGSREEALAFIELESCFELGNKDLDSVCTFISNNTEIARETFAKKETLQFVEFLTSDLKGKFAINLIGSHFEGNGIKTTFFQHLKWFDWIDKTNGTTWFYFVPEAISEKNIEEMLSQFYQFLKAVNS